MFEAKIIHTGHHLPNSRWAKLRGLNKLHFRRNTDVYNACFVQDQKQI